MDTGAIRRCGRVVPSNGGRIEPCGARGMYCPSSRGLGDTSRKRSVEGLAQRFKLISWRLTLGGLSVGAGEMN